MPQQLSGTWESKADARPSKHERQLYARCSPETPSGWRSRRWPKCLAPRGAFGDGRRPHHQQHRYDRWLQRELGKKNCCRSRSFTDSIRMVSGHPQHPADVFAHPKGTIQLKFAHSCATNPVKGSLCFQLVGATVLSYRRKLLAAVTKKNRSGSSSYEPRKAQESVLVHFVNQEGVHPPVLKAPTPLRRASHKFAHKCSCSNQHFHLLQRLLHRISLHLIENFERRLCTNFSAIPLPEALTSNVPPGPLDGPCQRLGKQGCKVLFEDLQGDLDASCTHTGPHAAGAPPSFAKLLQPCSSGRSVFFWRCTCLSNSFWLVGRGISTAWLRKALQMASLNS